MRDRVVNWVASLLGTNRNFDKVLNFQNQSRDMGLALVFKTNNNQLLPATSLFSPYFTLRFGLIDFEVSEVFWMGTAISIIIPREMWLMMGITKPVCMH